MGIDGPHVCDFRRTNVIVQRIDIAAINKTNDYRQGQNKREGTLGSIAVDLGCGLEVYQATIWQHLHSTDWC